MSPLGRIRRFLHGGQGIASSCQQSIKKDGPAIQKLAPIAQREGGISMDVGMDCHLKNNASVDCQYCHEPIER